ncbi:uncharacterized protein METZ01_LOCUS274565, partial [marine metagenome]
MLSFKLFQFYSLRSFTCRGQRWAPRGLRGELLRGRADLL